MDGVAYRKWRKQQSDWEREKTAGEDAFWQGAPARKYHFDFSYDGVMRSVEDSARRTGIDRFDMLLIHDADRHYQEAVDGAYRALDRLRSDGTVKAIGAGMNQNAMLARFARDGVMDILLLAGRYTILDHSALDDLFPACAERGTSILIGGVFDSGMLNDPSPKASFDYVTADGKWRENVLDHGVRTPEGHETGAYWVGRALAIEKVCDRYQVPLSAAALQFSAALPQVSSIAVGAGSAASQCSSARRHPQAAHAEVPQRPGLRDFPIRGAGPAYGVAAQQRSRRPSPCLLCDRHDCGGCLSQVEGRESSG